MPKLELRGNITGTKYAITGDKETILRIWMFIRDVIGEDDDDVA